MVMYIFNSDNDLALANFSPNYTPPASAVKLVKDLELLPLWYSSYGAVLLLQYDVNVGFVEGMRDRFGLNSVVASMDGISQCSIQEIVPWGWSPLLKNKLINLDMPEVLLPSLDYLETIRDYSDRKNAVDMLTELKNEYSCFEASSFYFTEIDQLVDYLSVVKGDSALKMPLSGSGKGLIWILGDITDKQTDWARRVIKNQGGVVAEPKLDRVQDFAMEFSINDGVITFEGYSLFETADSGAYMGNILMSDNEIENQLAEYISTDILQQLKQTLLQKLLAYFPLYNGILGVDMMIYKSDSGYMLQPCVEINMRMNMGMVAHRFYKRFVDNQSVGRYRVDYFKNKGEALSHHQKMSADYPLIIEDCRIKSGYMALAPVMEDTNYVAWVLISS